MESGSATDVDALLASAKSGDACALSTLFGMYQNYIKLLAASQVRSRLRVRASASDIAQETFLNAHRGFENFRGTTGGEFVAWLRSILTRRIQYLVQQHVQSQVRDVRKEVSIEAIGKSVDQSSIRLETVLQAGSPSPSARLQRQDRSVHVANALAELADDYREVLMLRSVEGLGFKEVAARMQRSHGATRMLWLRAIEALRDRLGNGDSL
ncbi:ECF RNA polymerase sigma-E factor [Stieleria maiorica]|uniref:ECF RNA polymerase sigma-E factor n=1 Tax=Stieleria maiorica TaxID=2795974 RepID=A0A5B9ML68_9BACT|nr:sigma-70 family RNA polymerase sigma factor [Stieleria maiorica]QEG01190.1 ECF RNA polymerase sigma-E factor [Stieleria maiorica]